MREHKLTRVTTPTHKFHLPAWMEVADFFITYQQNGRKVLEKHMGDDNVYYDADEHMIIVNLTQTDTGRFVDNSKSVVKCKVKTVTGKVLDSQFIPISILQTLHTEEM